ncbi:DUF1295 domain-containing protein [Nocardioides sp. SR21]|uniref:DUF1295 domain-containing protein n=1 Tax=Nocardioides sp. SR21 TaxID=2919501 RepID=UPI001FAAD810|nr:DUF1295 domain-containing protein [Nocardioides sp. SR21]
MPDWLQVAGLSLAAAVVVMTATAVVSARVGRLSVVDVAWGLALLLVAVVCAVWSGSASSWLLVGLVAAWALRLSGHIFTRSRGHGEDPRYAGMSARNVFVVQGAAVWLVSLPLQAAALSSVAWTWVVWLGCAVWAGGVLFETVSDAQLAAYKRSSPRPPVLDTGLWSWSRHPNYFGDACVWWGLWLVGGLASGWWPGLLSVVSPVAMTIWLVWVTGARLLERTMMQRPGYPAYAARTSMFVPLPPRR